MSLSGVALPVVDAGAGVGAALLPRLGDTLDAAAGGVAFGWGRALTCAFGCGRERGVGAAANVVSRAEPDGRGPPTRSVFRGSCDPSSSAMFAAGMRGPPLSAEPSRRAAVFTPTAVDASPGFPAARFPPRFCVAAVGDACCPPRRPPSGVTLPTIADGDLWNSPALSTPVITVSAA